MSESAASPARRLALGAARLAPALFALATGCATRIPIPDASTEEIALAEREAPASAEALANGANRRFWQIALEDPANQGKLPAELREVIRERGAGSVAEAFGDLARRQWNLDGPDIAGVSPSLLRSLASTSPEDAGQYLTAAAAIEELQAPVIRKVENVARRVFLAAERSDLAIVVDAQVGMNAFAPVRFGADRIFVGPLLALHATDDDELACAVGHEVAHITEGHTESGAWANLGRTTLSTLVAVAAAAAAAQANDGRPLTTGQIEGAMALGQLTTFLLADVPLRLSGWQRGQEREADAVGLFFAAKAGFDPEACARFMLRMGQLERLEGGAEVSWWVVHPPTGERVVLLRKLAVESRAGSLRLGGE